MLGKLFGKRVEFGVEKLGKLELKKITKRGFAVSADGSMIAHIKKNQGSQKSEGIISVMSPNGDLKKELIVPAYAPLDEPRLKFSSDGKTLVAVYAYLEGYAYTIHDLRSWECKTAKIIGKTRGVTDFDISMDGDRLALASHDVDGQVFIANIKGGTVALARPDIKGHGISVTFCLFSPDGSEVYSGWHDGAIIAWDIAGNQNQWGGKEVLKPAGRMINAATLSTDGLNLAVAWSKNHENGVTLYNTNTWGIVHEIDTNVCALSFAKSGQLLGLHGSDRSKVYVWKKDKFDLETTLELGSPSSDVFFSPAGQQVIGQASGTEHLHIWKIY
jgi:WD40 repeat protein